MALTDLALPGACGGCGAPGPGWCRSCASALTLASTRPVSITGPVAVTAGVPVVVSARYEGVVAAAIVAFKDEGRRDLLAALAPPMRAALCAAAWSVGRPDGTKDTAPGAVSGPTVRTVGHAGLVVVPAPSAPAARRRRGDVPTHLLVQRAMRGTGVLGVPMAWAPVLRHARRIADQSGLSRRERAANTDHAFEVTRAGRMALAGRAVLVADDVVTSGATLHECVRALRAVGARPVGAATLAATPAPAG